MFAGCWPLVGRVDELELVLDALRAGRGVVLSGQAGVGKSRLAAELLGAVADRGWSVVSLSAGAESEAVPFATFLPLLDDEAGGDVASRFLRAARSLTSKGDRVVVVIDDAHLLDEVSVAFVRHIVTATDVRLVLTIRSGELVPSTLVSFWQSDVLKRVEVLPLARDETDELLVRVLDGLVDGRVTRWVWETTRGNPLFIRELILDAIDTDALITTAGRWTLAPNVEPAGARLGEIIEARVGTLAEDERIAVELVALAEPLGLYTLASIVGVDVIARLEARSLLVSRSDRRRTRVGLAHPLHGEVVRATMGAATARQRRRLLIDAIESAGCRRSDDTLRVALWRVEVGDVADWRTLLTAASELARVSRGAIVAAVSGARSGDLAVPPRHLENAALLARAALVAGRSAEAAALLARILAELGHAAEARSLYEEMGSLASDDEGRLAVARLRSETLHFVAGDPGAAQAVLDEFVDGTTSQEHRLAAQASRSALLMLSGSTAEALEAGRAVVADERARREDVLLATASIAGTLGEAGDPIGGLETVDTCLASSRIDDRADLLGALVLTRVMLLVYSSRIDEADDLASTCRDIAASSGDDNAMGIFDIALANITVTRGDMATARALADDALRRVVIDDPYGIVRNAMSVVVLASALLGDVDRGRHVLAELDRRQVKGGLFSSDECRARAWLDNAEGKASRAAARLQAGAEAMAAVGRPLREATLLHDLVRLGHARHAVHRFASLAYSSGSPLVLLMARHAEAADTADAERLLAVSSAWEDAGFRLFAAEAAGQAVAIHTRDDRTSDAACAASRCRSLAAMCEGVVTPALTLAGPAANLTKREREIASLAARGMSDREIADTLVVSIRTVNAHLYNAYSKLGVDGRSELASVLGI
ncbi:MAG: LuxR family transcriptional regulator [Acidimicrobiia bacterium]